MIYDPMNVARFSARNCFIIIGICFSMGLFWSSMPLVGWSYYSLEGAKTSCSVEWNERSWNVTSYNATIFICVFLIPLVCIVATNLKLLFMVIA
jgi:c-opsin